MVCFVILTQKNKHRYLSLKLKLEHCLHLVTISLTPSLPFPFLLQFPSSLSLYTAASPPPFDGTAQYVHGSRAEHSTPNGNTCSSHITVLKRFSLLQICSPLFQSYFASDYRNMLVKITNNLEFFFLTTQMAL